jgi:hypothetical protein
MGVVGNEEEGIRKKERKERRVPALPLLFSKRITPLLHSLCELGSPQVHAPKGTLLWLYTEYCKVLLQFPVRCEPGVDALLCCDGDGH